MPIDKDAIAQFIGWMGELTMVNPLFNWRFYDSVRCVSRSRLGDVASRTGRRPPISKTETSMDIQMSMPNGDPDAVAVAPSVITLCPIDQVAARRAADQRRPGGVRSPLSRSRRLVPVPCTAFSDWLSIQIPAASPITYAERFARQYRQWKEKPADQVRHAARVRAVSDGGGRPNCVRSISTRSRCWPLMDGADEEPRASAAR